MFGLTGESPPRRRHHSGGVWRKDRRLGCALPQQIRNYGHQTAVQVGHQVSLQTRPAYFENQSQITIGVLE